MSFGGDCLIKKISDLRTRAKAATDKKLFDYVDGGADDEITLRSNREQWRRLKLLPRIWMGKTITKADPTCTLWGYELSAPLLIAPMAMHECMHKDGEINTARSAQKCGIPLCVSMYCSRDAEDIKASVPDVMLMQQMYTAGKAKYTEHLLRVFHQQGCRVIILTIDCQVFGNRERDARNRFGCCQGSLDYPIGLRKECCWKDVFPSKEEMFAQCWSEGGDFEWSYIKWMKSIVDVKVILKGILSPVDADLAVQHGADGIIVSNHGGRQLDTAVTASDVLPLIAKAVDKRIPILADGGIQRGSDIIKALALGASAVLIGRPVLYALAAGGAEEVENLLEGLIQEFQKGLALIGCKNIKDITSDLILHSY